MWRLIQCKQDAGRDVRRFQRHLELIEPGLLLGLVAAITGDDVGLGQAGLNLGNRIPVSASSPRIVAVNMHSGMIGNVEFDRMGIRAELSGPRARRVLRAIWRNLL